MSSFRTIAAGVAVCALLSASGARSQTATPDPAPPRADNYYATGYRVDITTPMGADVVVAGREISIAKPVAGDILAAGWHVVLSDRADDDVRMAGGQVEVDAPVAGDLTVAGGDVTIGPRTAVRGRSWLTGRTVRIDGVFERDLQVAGATVRIGGEIRRPLTVTAETLEIQPSARILGPVTYKGTHAIRIAEGAVINGPIAYEQIPEREAERARAWPAVSGALFVLHLLLVGLLVVFFLPGVERTVVSTLRAQPGWSLLAGFALLVATPVAAVVLVISVLGLPIGLAIGALYLMALFAGVLATAFVVGDAEARWLRTGPMVTRGQHALLLVAGVLTLALLRALLGGFVVLLSVLFGLGALALAAYHAFPRTTAVHA